MDNSEGKLVLSDNEVPRNALMLTDRQLLTLRSLLGIAGAFAARRGKEAFDFLDELGATGSGWVPGRDYPETVDRDQVYVVADQLQFMVQQLLPSLAARYGNAAVADVELAQAFERENYRSVTLPRREKKNG